jgi:hypothetical protein
LFFRPAGAKKQPTKDENPLRRIAERWAENDKLYLMETLGLI